MTNLSEPVNVVKSVQKEDTPIIDLQIEQKTQKAAPKKKIPLFCCCGLISTAVFCIAIFIGFAVISSYFVSIDEKNSIPADLEPAYFLNSMQPDYTITKAEEVEADLLLTQYSSSENDLATIRELIAGLKAKYPEGYYVVIQDILLRPEEFIDWYDTLNLSAAIFNFEEVMPHEITHLLGLVCGTYLVEDKCITILNYSKLSDIVFSGDKLLPYIEAQNYIDEEYLMKNKHTILVTLDEVNAYIKSVRADRAFDYYHSFPSTLARQMYYISLHLRYAKEEEPDVWNALVENKGFAYVLMRVVAMAEAELETAKAEGFGGLDVNANLKLYEDNKNYVDEYLTEAGVADLRDLDLSYVELQQRGVGFGLEIY